MSKVRQFVKKLLDQKLQKKFCFHSYKHTRDVARMAKEIAEFERLNKAEVQEVETAAWFHDTGFIECIKGHEEVSSSIAHEYLKELGWDDNRIHEVERLIKATKMDYDAGNLKEKILKDADTAHLGRHDYLEYLDKLRDELKLTLNMHFSDEEWKELNLKFLSDHKFYTDFGKLKLEPVKSQNYIKIQNMSKF